MLSVLRCSFDRIIQNKEHLFLYNCQSQDKRWVITAEEGKVFMVMKSYCKESFSFMNNFNFSYVENLVDVVDFQIETEDGRVITLKETGDGLGMVEDTSGFVM
jgi:hypothetical protein